MDPITALRAIGSVGASSSNTAFERAIAHIFTGPGFDEASLNKALVSLDHAAPRFANAIERAQGRAVKQALRDATRYMGTQARGSFVTGFLSDGTPLSKYTVSLIDRVQMEAISGLGTPLTHGPQESVRLALKSGQDRMATAARNEAGIAYRETALDAYRNAGVAKWAWEAKPDSNACPLCWSMAGEIFASADDFVTHNGCRCVPVPVIDGVELPVSGQMQFDALSRDQQEAIVGPGRMVMLDNGADLSIFGRVTSDPGFGPTRELIPLYQMG